MRPEAAISVITKSKVNKQSLSATEACSANERQFFGDSCRNEDV